METDYKKNWETLRNFVGEACNMKTGDTGNGMKKAYLSVFKLMQLIEDEEADGIVFSCGSFKKPVNILQIKG